MRGGCCYAGGSVSVLPAVSGVSPSRHSLGTRVVPVGNIVSPLPAKWFRSLISCRQLAGASSPGVVTGRGRSVGIAVSTSWSQVGVWPLTTSDRLQPKVSLMVSDDTDDEQPAAVVRASAASVAAARRTEGRVMR